MADPASFLLGVGDAMYSDAFALLAFGSRHDGGMAVIEAPGKQVCGQEQSANHAVVKGQGASVRGEMRLILCRRQELWLRAAPGVDRLIDVADLSNTTVWANVRTISYSLCRVWCPGLGVYLDEVIALSPSSADVRKSAPKPLMKSTRSAKSRACCPAAVVR